MCMNSNAISVFRVGRCFIVRDVDSVDDRCATVIESSSKEKVVVDRAVAVVAILIVVVVDAVTVVVVVVVVVSIVPLVP